MNNYILDLKCQLSNKRYPPYALFCPQMLLNLVSVALALAVLVGPVDRTVAQHSSFSYQPPTSSVHIHNGFASHSSSVLHQQRRTGHSLASGFLADPNDEAAQRLNFVQ